MIVRILGEGQLEVADEHIDKLNELDAEIGKGIEAGDDEVFRSALGALLDQVRSVGTPVPDDALVESDLLLPASDAHVDEVREMLGEEGLIPG
jgi:PspAA-like protein